MAFPYNFDGIQTLRIGDLAITFICENIVSQSGSFGYKRTINQQTTPSVALTPFGGVNIVAPAVIPKYSFSWDLLLTEQEALELAAGIKLQDKRATSQLVRPFWVLEDGMLGIVEPLGRFRAKTGPIFGVPVVPLNFAGFYPKFAVLLKLQEEFSYWGTVDGVTYTTGKLTGEELHILPLVEDT